MEISNVQHRAMASNQALMEEMFSGGGVCPKSDQNQERKPRPQPEQALKCPRCDSTNTKFCYYNNYSLSQPRYFCKGCRRYWTQGGSLRNVPVGGGCRKNKRSSSNPNSKKPQDDQTLTLTPNPNLPPLSYDTSNLTLAPFLLGSNPNPNPSFTGEGFLDILRSGFLDSANPAGFNNLCSYGLSSATTTVDGDESKVMMGQHWQLSDGNNGNNNINVAVDSSRDYWNGAGAAYNWHGIINSSLM